MYSAYLLMIMHCKSIICVYATNPLLTHMVRAGGIDKDN